MSRHCTRGKPASIITENCRVKIARFLAGTSLPLNFFFGAPSTLAGAFAGVIRVTRISSRRSAATAESIESATRSPLTVSPPRVRPV